MLNKLVTTYPHFCSRSSAILRISANNSSDARPTVSTRQTGQAHQLQTCRAHTQMSANRPISQHLNSAQICYLCLYPCLVSSPEPSAEQACYNLSTLLLMLYCAFLPTTQTMQGLQSRRAKLARPTSCKHAGPTRK